MKESEMESLMAAYRASLGTCSRRPEVVARRPRWRRMAFAATCLGVFALGGIAIWPRNAAAARIQRIDAAILNAKSMEEEYWLQTPMGRWRLFEHVYYRAGMWREEVRKSDPLQFTFVKRDGQSLDDYHQLDHATLVPDNLANRDPDQAPEQDKDALDYAKDSVGMGLADPKPTVTLHDHDPVDGAPTYVLTLDRRADNYHAEILVDRRTDLPISSEIAVDRRDRTLRYRQFYQFNQPLADALFSLTPNKPVVDLPIARRELTDRWATPIATVGECHVRDVSVTTDGTVWVTVTSPEKGDRMVLPTSISATGGTVYVSMGDFAPSFPQENRNPFKVEGEDVYIIGFVPLQSDLPLPNWATVSFTRRASHYPAGATPFDAQEEPLATPIHVRLRQQASDRPDYLTALNLDRFGLELPMDVPHFRAMALEASGRTVEAARAYELEAEANNRFVPHHATVPLAKAEHCYLKAGMTADAARVHAWAERVKNAD